MTIKELESRSGLDRATIRFYEKEGLISPQRLSNGYRDYSEEDALALSKIALLRRLGLPLEDIRAVQKGQLPLPLALEQQSESLRSRLRDTDWALRTAAAIRNEGASYLTLQPAKYQNQLPPPKSEQPLPGAEPREEEPAAGHPWMRFLARGLDETLYAIPAVVLLSFVLPWWFNEIYVTIMGVAGALLMLVLEPLLLSAWGWTPGKWLMGLRLRLPNGEKPEFGGLVYRAGNVWLYGRGLDIPIVNLICQWKAYRRCQPRYHRRDLVTMPREQPWEMEEQTGQRKFVYHLEERPQWMRALVPVLNGLAVVLLALFLWNSRQMPNRQEQLTVKQYVQNVNHVLKYNYLGQKGYRLKTDGTVTRAERMPYQLEIQTEKGIVTAIVLEYPMCDATLSVLEPVAIKTASIMALTGGTVLNVDYQTLEQKGYAEQEIDGWRMTHTVLDKPTNFAGMFELYGANVKGQWEDCWRCTLPDGSIPDPIPRLRMVIERVR